MKTAYLLAASAAILALAACNEGQQTQNVVVEETATVTQATPPPGGTWADVVNATSAGGFMMGNPNAKVKLVEIASLSCPYCKKFEDEGGPPLIENYVKTGKVSWEFRPFLIHGPIDMAANLIVRCNGVRSFFPLMQAAYADQPAWLAKIEAAPKERVAQIQNLPADQIFVAMASLLGLQDWAAKRGVSQAKSNQCLSDQEMIDREVQVTSDVSSQYPDFTGTPAFILNGKLLPREVASWDKLESHLQDALK